MCRCQLGLPAHSGALGRLRGPSPAGSWSRDGSEPLSWGQRAGYPCSKGIAPRTHSRQGHSCHFNPFCATEQPHPGSEALNQGSGCRSCSSSSRRGRQEQGDHSNHAAVCRADACPWARTPPLPAELAAGAGTFAVGTKPRLLSPHHGWASKQRVAVSAEAAVEPASRGRASCCG